MASHTSKFFIKANFIVVAGLAGWGLWLNHQNNELEATIVELKREAGADAGRGALGDTGLKGRVASSDALPVVQRCVSGVQQGREVTAAVEVAPASAAQQVVDNIELLSVLQAVDRKYDRMLAGFNLDRNAQEQLKRLLVDRERILSASTSSYYTDELDVHMTVEQHDELLAQIDAGVSGLLSTEDYESYEMFKESGLEQYQLTQFEQMLEGQDSIDTAQSQQLLMSKLKHKQQFMEAVSQAQLIAKAGDVAAANYSIELAVKNYQDSYFSDVQPLLTGAQYQALTTFELNEFEDIYLSLVAGNE